MNTVRDRLRDTRLDHGLSQKKADQLLGAKRGYISSVERGRSEYVGLTTNTLQRLLKIYPQMDVHWVVTGVCVFDQGLTEKYDANLIQTLR